MKKITFQIFIFTFYLIVAYACKSDDVYKFDFVASINGEKIFIEEIDLNVNQELYNKLYQIYLIRKKQIDKVIINDIIMLEAKKYDISSDSLINLLITSPIDKSKLLCIDEDKYNDDTAIFNPNKTVRNMSLVSDNQNNKSSIFSDFQLMKYLDSLKVIYKVTINLQPPKIPMELVDKISLQYKGNMKSQVTVWLISDLECNSCREAKPIYDTIFTKYKDKIKLAYSYYSDDVTISSLALECASTQNKFWEMYNPLNDSKKTPDFNSIINIAEKNGLDMRTFISEMQDSTTYYKIFNNFERISNAGFLGTPMIVINNKVISNPTSKEEIENVIEYELSRIY